MKNQALPKFLFIHEQSQQMQDRRIRVKLEYDTTQDPPQKIMKKKVNNTIKFNQKLKQNDFQINNLAYSNKLGLLIVCIEEEILFIEFQKLEGVFTGNNIDSLKSVSAGFKFQGKVYLSPNETKLLIMNQNQLCFYDLQKFIIMSRGQNQFKLRHFVFINDNSIVGWNFLSKAYFYSNINTYFSTYKVFDNIQMCTSVNVIQKNIVLSQKVNMGQQQTQNLKIHIWNQNGSSLINQIDLSRFDNPDNYLFAFTQILSIFPINIQNKNSFSSQDTYGLVLGYYDDEQYEPDRRYLNFMKGNIIEKGGQLQIRSFELFQSPSQDRSFYYDEQNNKIPFEVQIIQNRQMILIMIEKLQTIYVVDSTLKFDQLNLYSLIPSHQIKLSGKKYFKGMALMKNMLNFERIPSKKQKSQKAEMICKDFNGQFMSLYFPAKQTQLTVPFPATVLVLGDNTIFRRYAVSTMDGLEEYQIPQIKQGLSKIKKSPYLENIQKPIKVQIGDQIKLEQSKRIEEKQKNGLFSMLGQEKQTGSLFSAPKNQNKVQQVKKQSSSSIFRGQKKQQNTLFKIDNKKQTSSLLGGAKNSASSLFNNTKSQNKQQKKQETPFGQPSQQFSLFNKPASQLSSGPSPLFGNQAVKSTSLFGQKKQQQPQQSKPQKIQQKPSTQKQKQKPIDTLKSQQNKSSALKQQKQVKKQQPKPNIPMNGGLFVGFNPLLKALSKKKSDQQSSVSKQSEVPSSVKKQQVKQTTVKQEKKTPITGQKKVEQTKQTPKQENKETEKLKTPTPTSTPTPSKQVQKTKIQQKIYQITTSLNIDQKKLNELALILGHQSYQKMPSSLKALTPNQIQQLLNSLRHVQRGPVQPKKVNLNLQQQARKKLLLKEHFINVVKKFDSVRQFIKDLRGFNQNIESSKIFSFKNAQNILKIPKEQPLSDLKNGTIKVYTKRLQNLQKRYLIEIQNQQQLQNFNPNLQQDPRVIQQNLLNRLNISENKLTILQYYQGVILPEKPSGIHKKVFFGKNQNHYFESKLVDNLSRKIQKSQELKILVERQLQQADDYINLLTKKKYVKHSQIFSEVGSSKTKSKKSKKGCFKFSLENSSDQNEDFFEQKPDKLINQDIKISKSHNINNKATALSKINQPVKEQRKILIKFKPRNINLQKQKTKISPLFTFEDDKQPQIVQPKVLIKPSSVLNNKIDLSSLPNLLNSSKKSVDFKQKIPFQKILNQQKKQSIMKQSQSVEVSNLPSQNEQQQLIPPPAARMMSVAHPNIQKAQEQKVSKVKQQIKFKQTGQNDIKSDKKQENIKKSLAGVIEPSTIGMSSKSIVQNIDKSINQEAPVGAAVLGESKTKTKDNVQKAQKTSSTSSNNKLPFGNVNAAGLFGVNKTQQKKVNPQNPQNPPTKVKSIQTMHEGFVDFDIKIQKSIDPNAKPQTKEQKKQQQNKNSLSGATNEQKQKEKIQQKKTQQNVPKTGLFGLPVVPQVQKDKKVQQTKKQGLFGTTSLFFGQPDKKTQVSIGQVKKNTSLFRSQPNKQQKKTSNLLSGQNKKAQDNVYKQKQKQKQKGSLFGISQQSSGSLFGDKKLDSSFENKTVQKSLFGNNSGGLFGDKKTSLFGDKTGEQKEAENKQNSLFGPKPSAISNLSASSILQKQPDHLKAAKKDEAKQQKPIPPQQQQQQSLFGSSANPSLFGSNITASFTQPENKQVNASTSLFGGNMGLGHATSTFGGQNKFLSGDNTQNNVPSNSFNPNQLSFGGGSSQSNKPIFGNLTQNTGTNIPSLFNQNNQSNVGTGNLFAQPSAQQQQQGNFFLGQPQTNSMFIQPQGQSNSLFDQQQQQQQQQQSGLFAGSSNNNSGLFGGNTGGFGSSTNSNFLSGFQPTGNLLPQQQMQAPGANSTMFKPRK